MWRRYEKERSDDRGTEPGEGLDEESLAAWDRWEEHWDRPEEERVARWLRARGGNVEAPPPGQERSVHAFLREGEQPDQRLQRSDVHAGLPAPAEVLRSEVATLELRRQELAAALDAERSEAEHLTRQLAAELEAERVKLQDERRRMITAFQADQQEVERAIRVGTETCVSLEADVANLRAEVARLEEWRLGIINSMEAAVAAREEARSDELAAIAHLEAVREQAEKVEAEQFEIWVALDAEVTALRERLHALAGGDES